MRQQERRVYPKMNSIAPVVLSSWWNQQQFNAATGILKLESLRGQTYGTQGELVCLFARLFVQNFLFTGLQDFVSFRAKQGNGYFVTTYFPWATDFPFVSLKVLPTDDADARFVEIF